MLSGETSVGRYPERCVEALVRISSRIERSGGHGFGMNVHLQDERQKSARAAVTLADSLPDARLVVLTRRGVLANHVAMLRPRTSGFFAFTPTDQVCRQLDGIEILLLATCIYQVYRAFKMSFASNIEETIERLSTLLRKQDLVRSGTPVVILSDIISDHFAANSILLHHT